jgi:hypothetical protein
MATTTNYSFTLPTVGGSQDQWGTNLNANWTSLDALLGGVSAAEFSILDGATSTTVEVNYLSGVTSAIQTQIDAKAPIASPTFTGAATIPTATITTANVTTATVTTANITTVDFGDWTITEDAGVLKFATGGVNKMSLDASGNLTVVGNVNTSGTIA